MQTFLHIMLHTYSIQYTIHTVYTKHTYIRTYSIYHIIQYNIISYIQYNIIPYIQYILYICTVYVHENQTIVQYTVLQAHIKDWVQHTSNTESGS